MNVRPATLADGSGRRQDAARRPLAALPGLLRELEAAAVAADGGLPALTRLTEAMAAHLDVDRCAVWLLDGPAGAARCADLYLAGIDRHRAGLALAPESAECRDCIAALETGEPLAVADTARDPRLARLHPRLTRPLGIRALLATAVWRDGRLAGALIASELGAPRQWREDESAFLAALASALGRLLDKREAALARAAERRTDAHWRGLIGASRDGVVLLDAGGGMRFASPSVPAWTGHGDAAALGANLLDLLHPDDRAQARRLLRKCAGSAGAADGVLRVRNADGAWRHIEFLARRVEADGTAAVILANCRDITSWIEQQAQLETREAQLRHILDRTKQAVAVIGLDGRLRLANRVLAGLAGRTPEDVVDRPVTDFLHPDDIARLQDARAAVAARPEEPHHWAFRVRRRDGDIAWLDAVTQRIDWDGEAANLTSAYDITELRRKDKALRASEDRYRQLVEATPQGISVACDDRYLYVNRTHAAGLGYLPEEMVGQPTDRFLLPDDRPNLVALGDAFRGDPDSVHHAQLRFVHRDGSLVWRDLVVRSVPWGDGVAAISSVADITALKRQEAALAAGAARYRDLVEGSLQGISIHDEDGLLYCNEAYARMLGWSREELLAQPADVLYRGNADARRRCRDRLAGRPAPNRYEAQYRHRDGSPVWSDNLARVVEWNGKPAVQLATVDISDRKRNEERLRRAERMESLGQLTGGIAHDFNNILAVVLGNLDLIQERGLLTGEAAEMLSATVTAAERGADLTRSLLAFARQQQLEPVAVDMNELVRQSSTLLRRSLGPQVAMKFALHPELWAVLVDPAQMQAALLNLALNARDAMPQGGALSFATSQFELAAPRQVGTEELAAGRWVTVEVRDTGTGMPPEVVDRVFEPFFTTKAPGKGTGLGLSMVYGFVQQSDGHIAVESTPGAGSLFRFYLPAREALPTDLPQARAGDGPVQREEVILVVEDDPAVLETASLQLRQLGYRLEAAASAEAALAFLATGRRVDLLLTDIVLPGSMNGATLAERVRTEANAPKILLMTGYPGEASIPVDAAGVPLPLIGKPFRLAELAAAVRSALAGKEHAR